jgi:two-component system cell cycle sensor histidine kinase PleC
VALSAGQTKRFDTGAWRAKAERPAVALPSAARRAPSRAPSNEVKEVREKLTSSSGLGHAFDYDLLRLFAETRITSSYALIGLGLAAGLVTAYLSGLVLAVLGCVTVLIAHLITVTICRRFLSLPAQDVNTGVWHRRFVVLDLLTGMAWVFVLSAFFQDGSIINDTFALISMIVVLAVWSMVASAIPAAFYAVTMPVALAVLSYMVLRPTGEGAILTGLAGASMIFFVTLANRIFATSLATLEARAEKDVLIAELYQAKLNSDEARRTAEGANLAKSRFLAQMSHELRTPLNAILGFSEVMKGEMFGPHSSPQYSEYARDIHSSGEHLLRLINEILDLSRIEAGRFELNETAVTLAFVIADCHHLLAMRAKNKGVVIVENFQSNLPKLWADEKAIRQIVLNLMSNAIKFTPGGGTITLKIGWTASGGQYISVRDTGPGIPEDEIPVVLSNFGQGTNAIKHAEQGTGLGLPIVQGLIALHGGSFNLKSRVREGTEVIVTFPAERVMELMPAVDEAQRRLEERAKSQPSESKREAELQRLVTS